MRLASGPYTLRLLGVIGSRRAFPCRTIVGVVAFRVSYSVGRRVALSILPPRRGRVVRFLVLVLMRAMRLGRLPLYA